ncbi:MAG: histidine phosphatase family protein [Spirochaetales bacterium]|nr:histidine phosphatase family protein [Spirochaetales bacterium]
MKKLLLLRHGNALSRTGNISDYDRPLDNSGKKQIISVSNKLVEINQIPERIISSAALRAISSAEIIHSKKNTIELIKTEILYSAAVFEYIDIIKTQNGSFESIMIVAHNPAISGFAAKITGKHIGLGTGNLCILEIDIEKWSNLDFNSPVINSTCLKP